MAGAAILSLAFALTAAAAGDGDGWRYVLPPPGEALEHPPLRALVLSPARPDDVVEKAAYRGRRRRYAQLRYGDPNSVRVTVVLDEAGPGDADLYVDAGRNRRIEPADKVEPAADRRTWRLSLRPAFEASGSANGTAGEAPAPRSVVFRLGATGATLGFAAAGYLEGSVALRGQSHAHAARRVDGDGNGLLTDPQDRLWVDLNDDGRWDAAAEQFPYAPVLAIEGTRYAARSDVMGRRLSLDELEGTGTIRLALSRSPASGTAEAAELSALLVGRDGSAVSLGSAREEVVPVGQYRLAAVSIIVAESAGSGGARWSFFFADSLRRGAPVWHEVVKDGRHVIDPVGALDLRTGLGPESRVRPGEPLELQPQLYTSDGLLIVTAHRGTPVPGVADLTAAVELRGADGGLLGQARSGFL
jgi:hypothetical protein